MQDTALQGGVASHLAHVNGRTRLSAPSAVTQHCQDQAKREEILLTVQENSSGCVLEACPCQMPATVYCPFVSSSQILGFKYEFSFETDHMKRRETPSVTVISVSRDYSILNAGLWLALDRSRKGSWTDSKIL